MTDETPRALSVFEGARRAFLAEVERSLADRCVPGLTLEYRAVMPPPVLRQPPRTILAAGLSGAPGEVRVATVTAVRRVATTRPGSGGAALEQVRAYARSMGVAAVAGTYRTHEPFPAEGTLEYEVTIVEPSPRSEWVPATESVVLDPEEGWPVEQRYVGDPEAAAAIVVEWAEATRQRTPPGPRDEEDLRALRALAQARSRAPAGVDWSRVAALQAAGDLAEAWRAAGLNLAFDPADPQVWVDRPAGGVAAPAIPPAERLARRLAASGLEAIVDLGAMAERLDEHLERMRAALPAAQAPAAGKAGGSDGSAAPSAALTPAARAALADDLATLSPRQVLWHAPRDQRGCLLLGEQVLLAPYEGAGPLGQGRQVWLVATLPERRRDPQTPTLRLVALIGANHTHRWDEARWRWDSRAETTPVEARWGVAGLPLADLGPDAWRGVLAGPAEGAAGDEALTPGARAARCLLLQDAGRFEEALALYGVAVAPEVARLVRGEPLGWRSRALAAPWARAVQDALRDAAPWRFGPLLADAAAARARWLAAKRGRKRPLPELRLLRLPKQTGQTKAVLALAARDTDGGRPWLTLTWTGADDRLPEAAWRRDRDLDLLRLGLLAPADVPYRI